MDVLILKNMQINYVVITEVFALKIKILNVVEKYPQKW
jgi:hypothetical protein